jgi:mRNA-degrading endonuclease toxin of MazEF toxin-antitoxin module
MTSSLNKYDVVVVKFPFSDIAIRKARPAVVISGKFYNKNSRNSLLVVGISSKIESKLDLEKNIEH